MFTNLQKILPGPIVEKNLCVYPTIQGIASNQLFQDIGDQNQLIRLVL